MWKNIGVTQCLSYVNCQLRPGGPVGRYKSPIRPTITISRLAGSGGRSVASRLADYLDARVPVECKWTVFDRNLITKVMEDHNLPQRIGDFVPESHKSIIRDTLEELLGLHPSNWTLVQQTAETVMRLAQMGYVILVGRGGNIITGKLPNAFHVRLVGSLEKRTERVQEVYDLDRSHALEFIQREDKGRRNYLKEHFRKEIDDPLLYHLLINTDRVAYDEAARLIGEAVIHRFHLDRCEEAAVA